MLRCRVENAEENRLLILSRSQKYSRFKSSLRIPAICAVVKQVSLRNFKKKIIFNTTNKKWVERSVSCKADSPADS